MGTYSDESPSASIPEKIGNSLSKIGRALVPHAPAYEPASAGGETAQHAANRMSGDEGNHSSEDSSNTGPSGQSTDAYNKY